MPLMHCLSKVQSRWDARKTSYCYTAPKSKVTPPTLAPSQAENKISAPRLLESIYFKQHKQDELKCKIMSNQRVIREHIVTTQSVINPRTQARNIKQPHESIESMMSDRA